jgi:hypothetical protein
VGGRGRLGRVTPLTGWRVAEAIGVPSAAATVGHHHALSALRAESAWQFRLGHNRQNKADIAEDLHG